MRNNPSAVCAALTMALSAHPEQRTGQVIYNVFRRPRGAFQVDRLFFAEDHDLIAALMQYAGEDIPAADGEQGFSDGK